MASRNKVQRYNLQCADAFVRYKLDALLQLHPAKGFRQISRKRIEAVQRLNAQFPHHRARVSFQQI